MLDFILAALAFLAVSEGLWYYRLRKKNQHPVPIMKGAEPFFYQRGKTGVLLLHGFSATPNDFMHLGPYLAKKNYTVMAPLLPGHGTIPEHLASVKHQEYFSAAEKAFKTLKQKSNRVIVVGNSFGANLAVLLAQKYPVDGVVLLGMPYKMRGERVYQAIQLLVPLIFRFKRFKKKKYPTPKAQAIASKRVHYDVLPVNSLPAFYRVIKKSKNALSHVRAPVLIMESTNDHYLAPDNATCLYNKIPAAKKKLIRMHDAYHVLLSDETHTPAVCKEIANFIQTTAS